MSQKGWSSAEVPLLSLSDALSDPVVRSVVAGRAGRTSCPLPGPVLKHLPVPGSGLPDTRSDHGHERDQSLGRTRPDRDGERRAHRHAKRQTQNLGGQSAEDENRHTRERNVGWEI